MRRYLLGFGVLFLLACNKVDTPINDYVISSNSPLQISVSTSSLFSTKGSLVTKVGEMGSIGIYGARSGDELWSSGTEFSKLDNQRYALADGGEWIIDGETVVWGYESLSDRYTFFAYSPYCDDTQGIATKIASGELVIEYNVPSSSLEQPDLMFAMPCKDIFPQVDGAVPLTFFHALSAVSFGVDAALDSKITAIKISGVVRSGSAKWDYSKDSVKWSLGEVSDSLFSVDVVDYDVDENSTAQVTSDSGYLMMIPQLLESGADVVLEVDNDKEYSLKIPAGVVWEAGMRYHYVISSDGDEGGDFIFSSSQISNCYIINPTVGEQTVVQIPIEERINDFWKNYSGTGSNKIKNKDSLSMFWVSVLWEDFDEVLYEELDADEGLDYEFLYDNEGSMAVKLIISSKFQEGNLLFAVVKEDGSETGEIIWSWHLWFTDYNPDKIAEANRSKIEVGKDTAYTLAGYNGAVHRYADDSTLNGDSAVWSVMYREKFIMDRNIGERNEYSGGYGAGSVYYEYGRKDPFPGVCAKYKGKIGQPSAQTSSGQSFYESVWFAYDYFGYGTNASSNWSGETDARTATTVWYDGDLVALGYNEGKSIFDPSPLGWRVPVSNTWSNYDPLKTVAKYNNFGYRDAVASALKNGDSVGYVWSVTQTNYESACCFVQSTTPDTIYVTYGLPIRAIEE